MPEHWAYAVIRFKNNHLQQLFIKRSRNHPGKVRRFLQDQVAGELGDRYDAKSFEPPYNPWDQRVCLIPDGDLFAAIREGRADIVTGTIERMDAGGIALADGGRIDADVIVTATGLKLAVLGKARISLDGQPVDFTQAFYYRSCMFSNVPNFVGIAARALTSSRGRITIAGTCISLISLVPRDGDLVPAGCC